MRTRFLPLLLALALPAFVAACASDGADKTDSTPEGESTINPGKADCPDCDPAGPGAFEQAGIGETFYKVGDHWELAVVFTQTPLHEKRDDIFLAQQAKIGDVVYGDVIQTEAFLFDYAVSGTDSDVFTIEQGEGHSLVMRELATVEITQAVVSSADPGEQHLSMDRLDTYEYKVEFVMNDLLEPISETVYSRNYPNGRTVELDQKSQLKTGASLFPRTIPRILTSGVDTVAPELPADLAAIADSRDASWRDATYKMYEFDNGDVTYWSVGRGQLWPFYSKTRSAEAVLVGWNL